VPPGPQQAWQETPAGLLLDLRVQPNARKAGIEGLEQRADGRTRLRLKVTAPPEDGKANAAVVALLAKALGLPKRDLALVRGETARDKTLAIDGEPGALARRLEALVARS
jgi:uncharacterized protein (TIGR00251 family)